jgi:CarD family transcriptional regulator
VKAAAKTAAAEKIVSRKVTASKEKDKAARQRIAQKGKMTKTAKSETVAKPTAAKSRESGVVASALRPRSATVGKPTAAGVKQKKAAAASAKPEIKISQPSASARKKVAAGTVTSAVPLMAGSSKPTSTAAIPEKPSVVAAGSGGSSRPMPAVSAPVPRPPEASERIPVTEKKIEQPASLSNAKAAKSLPAASAPGGASSSAPKTAAENASAVRVVGATLERAPAAGSATAVSTPSKPAVARPAVESKVTAAKSGVHRTGFKTHEFIVYPAHGVGQIIAIEEQEVAGFKLELFVINFVKDKMTLKVPLPKVLGGAIRKLAEPEIAKKSLDTLTGRARVKRTMWSRRAQEYEAKINSGDLIAIAEVVRDLYRSEAQPEQSYSERQLYEAALDRMAREIAAVEKLAEMEALKLIEAHLQRGPRRGARGEASAEESADDGDIEEAA